MGGLPDSNPSAARAKISLPEAGAVPTIGGSEAISLGEPGKCEAVERDASTKATCLLCAQAYLDEAFALGVLSQLFPDALRASARNDNLNLTLLVRHSLGALSIRKRRRLFYVLLTIAAVATSASIYSIGLLIPWCILGALFFFLHHHIDLKTADAVYNDPLNAGSPEKTFPPRLQDRIDSIEEAQRGNVIIYSGFSPFVGSGVSLGDWSMVVDVSVGKRDAMTGLRSTPKPFSNDELYNYIFKRLRLLGIPNIRIDDMLYGNGKDVRRDHRFLKKPDNIPVSSISSESLRHLMLSSDDHIRYYTRICLGTWNEELTFSMFLRIKEFGSGLFVEASKFILTPVAEKYRGAEEQAKMTLTQDIVLFIGYLVAAPILLFMAVSLSFSEFFKNVWRRLRGFGADYEISKKARKKAIRNTGYDYGCTTTVRQWVSDGNYRRYAQKLDSEMFSKTVEMSVINALFEFLETKDIDIHDAKTQQITIFNQGMIMTGGMMNAKKVTFTQRIKNLMEQGAEALNRKTA